MAASLGFGGSNTNTGTQSAGQDFTSGQTITDGTTNTTGTSDTVNSADPDVIAMLKALAASSISNADDAQGQTASLVAGLFQSAKDSFTSVFGQQGASGLYNSSTAGVESDAAEARASADAASAVLGYKEQEQGVASTALENLLKATATSDTTNNSSTTSQTIANTKTSDYKYGQQTTDSSNESGGLKVSLVCTWMYQHKMLTLRQYVLVHKHMMREYPDSAREVYITIAKRLVKELDRAPKSWKSRVILWTFRNRTEYVIGISQTPIQGFLAKKLVLAVCFPAWIYAVVKNYLAPEGVEIHDR